jgi:Tfp pilus assembly protein PilF
LAAALVIVTVAAYSTSMTGVFVYDDGPAIIDNPNIRSLWPLTSALSAPPESPVSARPVAALSLAVNYALAPADARDIMAAGAPSDPPGTTDRFLRNVWGYHAMNLALHAMAALALAGVVCRTLMTERLRPIFGATAPLVSFSAACLWAVHPLTTDAVTYVAQRTEVLMGLCYGLTLYCAIRAGEPGLARGAARRWTTLAIAACAAGMGSKQTMVAAPIVVWVWDRLFLEAAPSSRRTLYAGLAATWLLLAALVAYERWPTSIGYALEGWTPWTYLLTQTTVIAHYVRLTITGMPLSVDYDGWPMSRSAIAVLPFAIPLAALLVVTLAGVVRRRAWSFPLVVWFAALAPSSSVLPLATEIAAERRMYVPLAAAIVLAVAGAYLIGRMAVAAMVRQDQMRRRVGVVAAALALATAVGACGSMTFARNRDFWSAERLWKDTVGTRPTNSRARVNYAATLLAAGDIAQAEEHLREAVRLKDTSAPAHLNLGSVLCRRGRMQECVQHLERALAIDPKYTAVYRNLGEAYGTLGNRAQAAKNFALAIEAKPSDPFLLNRLGWLLATAPEAEVRDGARAVEVAERAVRATNRRDATSLDTLAVAYAEADRFREAAAATREAISLAERQGPLDLLPELTTRLAMFEAQRKYRDPAR